MTWGTTVKRLSFLFLVTGLMFCNVAHGSGLEVLTNLTSIETNAVTDFQGLIGINMAAGDNHAQVNMHLIDVGNTLQPGVISQSTGNWEDVPGETMDCICAYAFQSSSGIVSINQAAGAGSAEANLVRIGYGADLPLDAAVLQQVVGSASQELKGENGAVWRADIISDHAFENSRGIVQVNQSAGVANAVSNSMAINYKFQ
ncbi:MAG: hypothetical protein GX147_04205 [Deltaproteobacteria bacterium]|nr:hypothetical protein [Deltaproteobacteria bacterium]